MIRGSLSYRGGPYRFANAAPILENVSVVELRIEGLGEIPLKVLGVQREIILLGRDFLRSFLVLVDGPRSRWQVGRLPLWGRVLLAGLRLR